MSTTARVSALPACDFCGRPALYDGKTTMGPWANLCQEHFDAHGVGLGTGKGQRLVTPAASVPIPDQPAGSGREDGLRIPNAWLGDKREQDPDRFDQAMNSLLNSELGKRMERYAGDDPDPFFLLWLALCERVAIKTVGCSIFDLSDWCWRDAYDDGSSPRSAVKAAVAADDLYEDFDPEGSE